MASWKGKPAAQQRYEQNQERAARAQGKALAKLRTEKAERSMAHMYETGQLRGRENVEKRLLIHACGYNLGVLMRSLTGIGVPRSLQGSGASLRLRYTVSFGLDSLDAGSGGLGLAGVGWEEAEQGRSSDSMR